jgi:hypothetical protein
MIDLDHPFYFLEPLFSREQATFHFSRYVYTPDSLFDQREYIEVSGAELDVEWLISQINALKSDQEFAIHSNVTIAGRTFHIPMIDFAIPKLEPQYFDRINAYVPPQVFVNSSYYHTGRSYHAYSTTLLQPKEWREFLGRLLLINSPHGDPIIDTRWIGHRLIAGYCSLRLSNNSKQYKGMPRKIGIRSIFEGKPMPTLPDPGYEITDR